jgi:hypothetical protein
MMPALADAARRFATARADRDRLIGQIRALPDSPSARAVAEVAGVSDVEVLRIAKRQQ